MTDRKFYRKVVTVEILSESPITMENMEDVQWQITDGSCSGKVTGLDDPWTELDGRAAAVALLSQGSAPSFFMLNEKGDDDE